MTGNLATSQEGIIKGKMFLGLDNDQGSSLPYLIYRTKIEVKEDIKEDVLIRLFKELLEEARSSRDLLKIYPVFLGSEVQTLESLTGIALYYKREKPVINEELLKIKMYLNLNTIRSKDKSFVIFKTRIVDKDNVPSNGLIPVFKTLIKELKSTKKQVKKHPVFLTSEVEEFEDEESVQITLIYKKIKRRR